MTVGGHIYGIVLNDRTELAQLAPRFEIKPYEAVPRAPVVYMKPRTAIARGPVRVSRDVTLRAAPTLGLLFARDASHCAQARALDCLGAICLALDFSRPQSDYYRPAVAQANQDGFLVLGDWDAVPLPRTIETRIDGNGAHAWSLERLARDPARLISDLSAFMTLRAGDVLLVGLPGDAPKAHAGQTLTVSAPGLPALHATLEAAA